MAPIANRGFDYFESEVFRTLKTDGLVDFNRRKRERIGRLTTQRRFWRSQFKEIGANMVQDTTVQLYDPLARKPITIPTRTTTVHTRPSFAEIRARGHLRSTKDLTNDILFRTTY